MPFSFLILLVVCIILVSTYLVELVYFIRGFSTISFKHFCARPYKSKSSFYFFKKDCARLLYYHKSPSGPLQTGRYVELTALMMFFQLSMMCRHLIFYPNLDRNGEKKDVSPDSTLILSYEVNFLITLTPYLSTLDFFEFFGLKYTVWWTGFFPVWTGFFCLLFPVKPTFEIDQKFKFIKLDISNWRIVKIECK